ncbi:MAG: protein-export chaperone SecB [Hyphomicrobiales bacterium]
MNVQLNSWRIVDLAFKETFDAENEHTFELNAGHFFPEEDNKQFFIHFGLDVFHPDYCIKLKAEFLFEMDEEITEEFKSSNFPKINAPAIAFPFLRAFISNLVLQSGFEPAILPSINFVKLANQEEK